ncbi:DNA/RNA-binding protein KIN17 [Plutella xylostella]|uniref:DNA/RNA-binding protein KIN17 n=1 Tax=Plutella xylostella TaxID=51655 RepID=UPI0020331624|nr:DNA/RNA-binding protein KIN17 [Plutella xylostella]XP_048485928.1 DNA/RNA-binding protein KIN17 [Plutella xylostella]
MGGKAEKGTPKYIANKIKAKGLQKLRWYCQMCQKQCRDENGFKCHTMSESHQRQLLLFADNANKYIDEFSKEFSDGYLELLKRQFGTKRVNANKVYQDYISHKDHLHMNATQWETLTEFVKWLGREGKCVVDETEKGWFVAYIDRDPATIAAQEAKAKKEKMDKDDQERMLDFIAKQVERGKSCGQREEPTYSELKREGSQERLSLNLQLKRKTEEKKLDLLPSALKLKEKQSESSSSSKKSKTEEVKSKHSALDDIIKMEESKKERNNRKDYWLTEGIVVKVVTKSLGDKFYKRKAVIEKVIDKYGAQVKLLDDNVKLKLDQNHIETVIPSPGRAVRFVNGAYRGHCGLLRHIHTDSYCCDVEISEGPLTGRLIKGVQYEDISKLAS